MAEFCSTTGISHRLEEILKKAQQYVIIVSPYLKTHQRLRELIKELCMKGVGVIIIYGKEDIKDNERGWMQDIKDLRVKSHKNLHAKCYLNEDTALVTSMNLYDYSQIHNTEMGILVSREDDSALYQDIAEEVKRIIALTSDTDDRGSEQLPNPVDSDLDVTNKPTTGFCIKCGIAVPHDVTRPYCRNCYRKWARKGKNKSQKTRRCHKCNTSTGTTFSKPLCKMCYTSPEQ